MIDLEGQEPIQSTWWNNYRTSVKATQCYSKVISLIVVVLLEESDHDIGVRTLAATINSRCQETLALIDTCRDPYDVWKHFIDYLYNTLYDAIHVTSTIRSRIWEAARGIRSMHCGIDLEYLPSPLMGCMMMTSSHDIYWPTR
jgi:hypothetical protein